MNNEELLICISAVTIVSFFSLIPEIAKWGAQTPSYLSDSCESVVKSEHKSPFYKLWQYAIKNKPSTNNESAVYFNNEKYVRIQGTVPSYQCSPERFEQSEDYITLSTSINFQKQLSVYSKLSFYKRNNYNIGWFNIFGFFSYIYIIVQVLSCIKHVLGRNQIYVNGRHFKLNNLTSQIYRNVVWQQSKEPCRIYAYLNRVFHHQVCCL
ncbi:hypothetical protein MEI_00823 [Bartonella vinsonii subsp. arupensis Pm136co]|uniref:Uncharacterized protein n=1 Tax=Bartonella vinsonii subsp. arupensis Pm136co TaxID=1094561 RepID=A0ABN0MWU3_BARVI|nr:hypothetical protein MEI_00823 [Bartonella vinsonii subsp. arupensis Pm136co]